MRGLPRGTRIVSAAAVLALAIAACGGDDDKKTPEPGAPAAGGGSISIESSNPQFLLPTNTNETSGAEILDALFTGLVTYAPETNEPQPSELAESIETTDQQNYTIKIKAGWKFHNGEDVTAQSFVDAWNYGALNKNGQNNNYFFGSIEGHADLNPEDKNPDDKVIPPAKAETLSGLKVVSPTEFTVKLAAPDNTFYAALGYTAFYPMSKAGLADVEAFEKAPIGNGPFKMKGSFEPNKQLVVERYAEYKGTQPKVDQITFKIFQSLETAYNELQAGSLDVMDNLPPSALADAPTVLGDRYQQFPSSYYQFLGFPTFDPKFQNVKIRHAISRAIDREGIAKTIFQGTRVAADGFVNPVVAGARKGICGDPCKYDPEAAKALLAEGGGLDKMTITYNADGGHKDWTEAACNQIKQNLGVDCTAVPKEGFDNLLDDLDKAKKEKKGFGPFRLGWIMDYPSMQNYLGPLYGSKGSSNYYGYANAEFDKLVADGQKEATLDAAIAKWQQAEDILVKDFPVAPLWFGVNNTGRTERIGNFRVDPFDRIDKVAITVTK
jgi:oligopeptide transport system substrate-binding protein